MAGERGVLTLGGKGSSLSPASVFKFSIASPPQLLNTDPSALARLSSSPSNHKQKSASAPSKVQLSVPDFLTPEEAKASFLLLYKHLLGGSSFSFTAVSQLSDILNNDTQPIMIDLNFYQNEDINKLRDSWKTITLNGICALLHHTAFSLATVADAVAALSCEALKADTSTALSFTDSGDGFSDKNRTSVSRALKVLLNGSKSCGKLQCDQVDDIPIVHGRLRSIYELVHSSTRIAVNSTQMVNGSVNEDLTGLFSFLASAFKNLGKSSWHRANLCLKGLEKDIVFPTLIDSFNAGCPGLDLLEDSIKAARKFELEEKYVESVHTIYILAEAVRKILSWEATGSFISLEASVKGKDGGIMKPDKKDKKAKVMGKGTTVLMQFIKDKLQSVNVTDSSTPPEKVAQGFLSFLDFKGPHFESLVKKVRSC